ncbi:MAG: hypothetical protein JKY56_26810 [Kofleriaceae bacterium]|nr:hypothetical protein [Kofleriaceae bacterium]
MKAPIAMCLAGLFSSGCAAMLQGADAESLPPIESKMLNEQSFAIVAEAQEQSARAASRRSSPSSASTNTYFSMSLKSECSRTVKLFLGKKPKYGSGETRSISSNSINSFSGTAGKVFWIVDGSGNGVSSDIASAGSQSIKTLPSSAGFAPRKRYLMPFYNTLSFLLSLSLIGTACTSGMSDDVNPRSDSGGIGDASVSDGASTQPDASSELGPDAGNEPFFAQTNIDYSAPGNADSATFSTCFFCDASDAVSHVLLRYQQGDGFTIWAIYIPKNASLGTGALTPNFSGSYATLSANDSGLFDSARGFYGGDINNGTVTYTKLNLESGGVIEGTIDVSWTKSGTTAHMTSSFRAVMP